MRIITVGPTQKAVRLKEGSLRKIWGAGRHVFFPGPGESEPVLIDVGGGIVRIPGMAWTEQTLAQLRPRARIFRPQIGKAIVFWGPGLRPTVVRDGEIAAVWNEFAPGCRSVEIDADQWRLDSPTERELSRAPIARSSSLDEASVRRLRRDKMRRAALGSGLGAGLGADLNPQDPGDAVWGEDAGDAEPGAVEGGSEGERGLADDAQRALAGLGADEFFSNAIAKKDLPALAARPGEASRPMGEAQGGAGAAGQSPAPAPDSRDALPQSSPDATGSDRLIKILIPEDGLFLAAVNGERYEKIEPGLRVFVDVPGFDFLFFHPSWGEARPLGGMPKSAEPFFDKIVAPGDAALLWRMPSDGGLGEAGAIPPKAAAHFVKGTVVETLPLAMRADRSLNETERRFLSEAGFGPDLAGDRGLDGALDPVSEALLRRRIEVAAAPTGFEGLAFFDGVAADAALRPGPHWFWKSGCGIRVEFVDMRERSLELQGQEIIAKDKATVRVNSSVSYRVTDSRAWLLWCDSPETSLYKAAQLVLRETVANSTLDRLLEDRQGAEKELSEKLRAEVPACLDIARMALKDVTLPGDVKALVNKSVEAEHLARANAIARRDETQNIRSLLNAAKALEDNPMAARLKDFQTLESLSGKIANLSVFGGLEGLLDSLVGSRPGARRAGAGGKTASAPEPGPQGAKD